MGTFGLFFIKIVDYVKICSINREKFDKLIELDKKMVDLYQKRLIFDKLKNEMKMAIFDVNPQKLKKQC